MLSIKSFVFNPVQENTYILYNAKKQACIIDPGCYFPEEQNALLTYILENGLEPVLLLNTHCHFDHIFGNKFIVEQWNLLPHMHRLEKPVLDRVETDAQEWQIPFESYKGEVIFIREGDTVSVGNEEMETRFTPGHSPGSISFYHEAGGFIIGGDVLFDGSIGRTDFPGGDYPTLVNSIQTQFFTLPDETKVYAGHGPVTTVGFEKMNNPYLKLY